MGVESCFQVSSIASSATTTSRRAWANLHSQHQFSSKARVINLSRPLARCSFSSSPKIGHKRLRRQFICQANNAVDEVLVVVDKNWDNLVTKSDKPVLVEFWAPWCGPCRMIAPVIAELAKEYAGKLVCCQVNTDDCAGIASKYGIRSIPTVLMFKDGEKKESVIGAVPKSALVSIVDKYVETT